MFQWLVVVFAAVIVLASFLFFLVQPMVARTLLPAFGGASSVWTVCLLFFQTALMLGYAYAHTIRRAAHGVVVVAAVLALTEPVPTTSTGHPTWAILRTLALTIGLSVTLLASTSPLAQRWSRLEIPYRLYALSNAASLGALLAYPFLIEPALPLSTQWSVWRILYFGFAGLSLSMTWQAREHPERSTRLAFHPLWVIAPAASAALLMATTNQLTQEVASVPFLWVLPLAVYLLSFILAFERSIWYQRGLFAILAAILIPISCTLVIVGINIGFWWHLLTHTATLFVCSMLCHGELSLARPDTSRLTSYYLAIALGGAIGGLLVALVAPTVFSIYAEFPIALAVCAAIALPGVLRTPSPLKRATVIGLALAILVPATVLTPGGSEQTLATKRNFYGILRVTEADHRRTMTHGAITHGAQLLDRPNTPTTYYGYASAAGRILDERPAGPARVGIIGLGAGTLARYGRPGDVFRFYELNPEVVRMARKYFTFLSSSAATIEVVEGDARLQLDREPSQDFDYLVVDAFSSDSIPVHLLTKQAALLYGRHLKPTGTLLIHISNHTLDLEPVVNGVAQALGWGARRAESLPDGNQATYSATWMILKAGTGPPPQTSLIWTDDFTSLVPLLKSMHRR